MALVILFNFAFSLAFSTAAFTTSTPVTSLANFDTNKEKELAPLLLQMITKLISRLNEINDGSFEIHDMISDHLRSLINGEK